MSLLMSRPGPIAATINVYNEYINDENGHFLPLINKLNRLKPVHFFTEKLRRI